MAKTYGLVFSATDPRTYPSLAPTFLTFQNMVTGSNETPPGITQLSTTGVYFFNYGATQPTYFLVDGITTSSSTERYVSGILDPIQAVNEQAQTLIAIGNSNLVLGSSNIALGTTNVAIGTSNLAINTSIYAGQASIIAELSTLSAIGLTSGAISVTLGALIGNTSSSIGDTMTDPIDIFGFLKRLQEFNEGNASFSKTAGTWTIQTRGSTTFATKTLGNTSTEITKV